MNVYNLDKVKLPLFRFLICVSVQYSSTHSLAGWKMRDGSSQLIGRQRYESVCEAFKRVNTNVGIEALKWQVAQNSRLFWKKISGPHCSSLVWIFYWRVLSVETDPFQKLDIVKSLKSTYFQDCFAKMGKSKFSETKVFLVALLLLHFFPLRSDAARQSSRLVRLFTSGGMNKVLQYVWIRSPVLPSFSSPTKFTILKFFEILLQGGGRSRRR